jgi:hypothetical protein
MKTQLKLTAVALASLAAGAAATLAISFANPFRAQANTAPITHTDGDGTVHETFSFIAPEDGIAATHDGEESKPVKVFPQGIGLLNDKHLKSAFVLLAKARDKNGTVVGFASEMEEVAPQSNIMQGRMHMLSTWTLELPGRGTIFMYETEDASEFAKKVIVPALAFGKTWDQPWTFTTTTGPRPDGRGTIVGGTGEFEGVTGAFTEVTHLRKFTPDGQLSLTMELRLAYKKPEGNAARAGSGAETIPG